MARPARVSDWRTDAFRMCPLRAPISPALPASYLRRYGTDALGQVRENVRATDTLFEAIVSAGSRVGLRLSRLREYRALQ